MSPSAGRFLTRDPIGYSAGANQYRFIRNRALRYVDSRGWFDIECYPSGTFYIDPDTYDPNTPPRYDWQLRFRANYRSVQIAREIRTYRVASMLHVPRLKASLPSLRPMNCLGIPGRHLQLSLVLSVAARTIASTMRTAIQSLRITNAQSNSLVASWTSGIVWAIRFNASATPSSIARRISGFNSARFCGFPGPMPIFAIRSRIGRSSTFGVV